MQANDVDARVRRRLRELRTEQGLTLQQVAERANLDVSTLSRLESGKRRLALDHLPGLAGALGVSTDELLGPPPRQDPRVHSKPRRFGGLTMWPLTHRGPATSLHAFRFDIDAARNEPPKTLPVHEGQDWFYVLEGRLRLVLGEDDVVVEPGEVVQFSCRTPHWFGAVDGPVSVIAVLSAQGEQAHLHR